MYELETSLEIGIIPYINERALNIVKYSDKLSIALQKIDKYFEEIGPKAGIRFTDPDVFYTEFNDMIGKVQYRLRVSKDWGLYAAPEYEELNSILVDEAPRTIQKAAIKRIPAFLKLYAEALQKYEKEYEEVSEAAEKISEILVINQ